jgi:uncharacterized protein involved in type VI secretion and phage assembly
MHGVVTGTVTDIDEAAGRLKVEFGWIQDDYRSGWAPIATPMTGKSRGVYFLPETGDEVLVGFEHGDFEHPYILGYLWNGVDTAPENEKDNRIILTPGGHTLRFEDKEGQRRVILRSSDGRSITLDDTPGMRRIEIKSGSHTILMDDTPGAGKVEITTGGGQSAKLLDAPPTASVALATGAEITVGASGLTVTVPGGAIAINAAGALTVNAGGTVALNAGGAVSLTASAVSVNAAVTNFSGIVNATAINTTLISAQTYTPGVGNLI